MKVVQSNFNCSLLIQLCDKQTDGRMVTWTGDGIWLNKLSNTNESTSHSVDHVV